MSDEEIVQRIETVLNEIRPNMQMDGSDVILERFENGIARLRLEGDCLNFPMIFRAMASDVKQQLYDDIPELDEVVLTKQVNPFTLVP